MQGMFKSILILGLIIITTIHATDIPDITGDLALNRSTFPIAFPTLSRVALAISLLGWSLYGVVLRQEASMGIGAVLSIYLAVHHLSFQHRSDKKQVYHLYLVRVSTAVSCL